ncbi:tyrosine/phenylalanine carboxypeptidase domain-containing protein [Chondromyces apiculatus]|uniref:DUF1704 domain-containing protein n=1 Tax=Chondromyces apiculatus DSM 436 TaxID=1192034 RepID=A0A017T508_9BACT|nr:tyrosine/phenylalanine carboxypeptidase domain-containing protein [Chondromyces apiculatus]EYF04324.1 Hypothetical protein CAP_4588 [Chondromyces apiculatus DSM 436]
MSRTAPLPDWLPVADRALAEAALRVRVVGATTPVNLGDELARLTDLWTRSGPTMPHFVYAPPPSLGNLRAVLARVVTLLDGEAALGKLYAARALELDAEATVCEAAGSPECWASARRRYAPRDTFDDAADDLAAGWIAEAAPPGDTPQDSHPGPHRAVSPAHPDPPDHPGLAASPAAPARSTDGSTWSDDEGDPRSLVSRMRQEVGIRRLPVRVMVLSIAPLAATGDGVIQVAARRRLLCDDVERTVLHEIEGHAVPWVRSRERPLGIFTFGTRWGSDDQEGRALRIEQDAGFLRGARRRELALRHLAARSVACSADFVETARLLLATGKAHLQDALRITARVHRGGGLGREVVYLPALLRVEHALTAQPDLDVLLGAGRVAVDAAPVLAPWV